MITRIRSFVHAWLVFLLLQIFAIHAWAHVGSPDIYVEGNAGPYKLSVVIRPPLVIPGVADIELRSQTPGIERVEITPIPLTGEASKYPPVPDLMQRPASDPGYFTGHLWIMATGSWQIRFTVRGGQGSGIFSAPVPATAIGTRKMQPALGLVLAVLGILLIAGLIGIVGAATREAQLAPGIEPPPARRRRAYVAMTITFVLSIGAVIFGNHWWGAEAADYGRYIYKPLKMRAQLEPGNVLDLQLSDPGWLKQRKLDDFIPDHDHLMHLYMLRWPFMDVVFHLHPQPAASGDFRLELPSVPAGEYRLYADVVHENGFPETTVSSIQLPKISGRPLVGDDAEGTSVVLGPGADQTSKSFRLPDGYSMVWKRPDMLAAKTPYDFTFELLDPRGLPASDVALYMGMLGHAVFVKDDGTVFAHIHPSGTVSMAALMIAQAQNQPSVASSNQNDMPAMPGMSISHSSLSNIVSFPYGFPSAGIYRIIVQMKHGTVIETGFFDVRVGLPKQGQQPGSA